MSGLHVVIAAWLKASQRSCVAVGMNRSCRGCRAMDWILRYIRTYLCMSTDGYEAGIMSPEDYLAERAEYGMPPGYGPMAG